MYLFKTRKTKLVQLTIAINIHDKYSMNKKKTISWEERDRVGVFLSDKI